MDSLKDAYELLEHTAKGDLLSEKLWKSNKVQSLKNFFVNRSRNNEFFYIEIHNQKHMIVWQT